MQIIFGFMKYISILTTCMAGALLTGCSILDKSQKYVVQGSEGAVTSEREVVLPEGEVPEVINGPVLTPPKKNSGSRQASSEGGKKAVKNKKGKKGGADTSVSRKELEGARNRGKESVSRRGKGGSEIEAQESGGSVAADFNINGEWTVYAVRGNKVEGEERPYITFDLRAKRFYGNNGCNVINGDISVGNDNSLSISNVISTMKMCQDAPYEYTINLAIDDVRSFRPRQEGSITFLDLIDKGGKTVMELRRHNMDFLNGAWEVTALNGAVLTQADKATITINVPDLRIHGTTGCNIFNGNIFIDPDKRHSMQFVNLATTRMGCPPDSRETEFLLALEQVESARTTGVPGEVIMTDPEGTELFRLSRIKLPRD